MTNEQCRTIAEASVRVHDARHLLRDIESKSADHQSVRTQRRALAAAEAELDRAITAAVQR